MNNKYLEKIAKDAKEESFGRKAARAAGAVGGGVVGALGTRKLITPHVTKAFIHAGGKTAGLPGAIVGAMAGIPTAVASIPVGGVVGWKSGKKAVKHFQNEKKAENIYLEKIAGIINAKNLHHVAKSFTKGGLEFAEKAGKGKATPKDLLKFTNRAQRLNKNLPSNLKSDFEKLQIEAATNLVNKVKK